MVEIESLAYTVVARAVERDSGVEKTPEGIRKGRAVRIANGDVVETGRARRRRRAAAALPGVQPDVVMVSTGAEEGGGIAHPLRDLESQYTVVERQRTIQIGDLEVNVSNVDAGVDWRAHLAVLRISEAIWSSVMLLSLCSIAFWAEPNTRPSASGILAPIGHSGFG